MNTEVPEHVLAWIREQVAKAKPFSDQQRTVLAELLRPVRDGGHDA